MEFLCILGICVNFCGNTTFLRRLDLGTACEADWTVEGGFSQRNRNINYSCIKEGL